MEISEAVRPRVRIRGISKIQTTAAQECRVGFHGKCRRDQREFSPSSDSLSLSGRVCVLHLRTEKLTSREEWRELFV